MRKKIEKWLHEIGPQESELAEPLIAAATHIEILEDALAAVLHGKDFCEHCLNWYAAKYTKTVEKLVGND